MPRPKRCRIVCNEPEYDHFSPSGIAVSDTVTLMVDEFEIIRLVDLEHMTHQQAAVQMEISRTTATEIYNYARTKIADCIVNGKRLVVSGGDYQLCQGKQCGRKCMKQNCQKIHSVSEKGNDIMRIAVTYENGQVFQHFGHTEQFKIYDVQGGEIVKEEIVSTMGSGHGALAGFLTANSVDTLICGGIGGGAQTALTQAGIRFYGGVRGSADEAVKNLLNEKLSYNPDVKCSHHDHEHGEGGHTCGSNGCGNHGCH